jgi:hypothetical protein
MVPAVATRRGFMHLIRLEPRLAHVIILAVVLLLMGMFGFGVAIRYGAVVPRPWEVRLYKIHILAYRTDYPECPPTTLCPQELVAPSSAFYVVWRINNLVSDDQPDSRRSIASRLLVVPLKR